MIPFNRDHDGMYRAVTMLKSITSGTASSDVIQIRAAACERCSERVEKSGKSYCRACGCGEHPLAELQRKIQFAYCSCPLKKSGFSNGGPPG